jgi:biotin carboxyl carrier protein
MKEYKYKINGMKFAVEIDDNTNDDTIAVQVNGVAYKVELDESQKPKKITVAQPKKAAPAPRTESGEKVISKPTAATSAAAAVKSPLPGTIMSINVNVGDTVNSGDTVCVLEAMKMENDVHTDKAGTVKKILVGIGDSVLEGTDLIVIE